MLGNQSIRARSIQRLCRDENGRKMAKLPPNTATKTFLRKILRL